MDKFLEMQTFAAVVDAGSFVQAAETLDRAAPFTPGARPYWANSTRRSPKSPHDRRRPVAW